MARLLDKVARFAFTLAIAQNAFTAHLVVGSHTNEVEPQMFSNRERVAVCFWGVNRALPLTVQSLDSHIFLPLSRAGVPYDVFFHTYSMETVTSKWSGEENQSIPGALGELKLLKSRHLTGHEISNQDEVDQCGSCGDYFGQTHVPFTESFGKLQGQVGITRRWDASIFNNVIRALFSLHRVTLLWKKEANSHSQVPLDRQHYYSKVLYLRPDLLFVVPLDVTQLLNLKEDELLTPHWGQFSGWPGRDNSRNVSCPSAGLNDRLAAASPRVAEAFGSRLLGLKDYIRSPEGKLRGLHPEYFVAWTMVEQKVVSADKLVCACVCGLRARSTGPTKGTLSDCDHSGVYREAVDKWCSVLDCQPPLPLLIGQLAGLPAGNPTRSLTEVSNSLKGGVCACLVTTNSAPQLEEWLEFHRRVGVHKVFAYNDNATDKATEAIFYREEQLGFVKVLAREDAARERLNWRQFQAQLFNHCVDVAQRNYDCDWLVDTDVDEYLVPQQLREIPNPLKKIFSNLLSTQFFQTHTRCFYLERYTFPPLEHGLENPLVFHPDHTGGEVIMFSRSYVKRYTKKGSLLGFPPKWVLYVGEKASRGRNGEMVDETSNRKPLDVQVHDIFAARNKKLCTNLASLDLALHLHHYVAGSGVLMPNLVGAHDKGGARQNHLEGMRKKLGVLSESEKLIVDNSALDFAPPPVGWNPPVSANNVSAAGSDVHRYPNITPNKAIVAKLLKLARLSAASLKYQLDVTDGADVFELKALERGECPSHSTIDWLPARPNAEAAQNFRRHGQIAVQANHSQKGGRGPPHPALLWYEHVSKAGGTSFCQLARNNMNPREVPAYYCMPSEPPIQDARVGQWSNEKLDAWCSKQKQGIVSNEWEPFPLKRFKMNKQSPPATKRVIGENMLRESENSPAKSLTEETGAALDEAWPATPSLLLLFVTTLREPLNRLLSAYHFWGVLTSNQSRESRRQSHRKSRKKLLVKPSVQPPVLSNWLKQMDWLKQMEARALNDSLSDVGIGKGVGTGKDMFARVGQPNFATWKFSGGSLPVFGWPFSDQPEEAWVPSFEQAVRTLTQFDLAIPLEDLSKHPEPLEDILGWTNFSITHVVSRGKVMNNDAQAALGAVEYLKLFDANRLDYILYSWTRAVYLARAHCIRPGWA